MCEILIFGGTTEGRTLADFCAKNKISAYISVTTSYGAELIQKSNYLNILTGKMDCDQMLDFIKNNGIKLVIDATHPYAEEASRNISYACDNTHVKFIRVIRKSGAAVRNGRYFDDINSLVNYLNNRSGNIFITTGSKELRYFCNIKNFRERCTVRVLPSENIVSECMSLGFYKTHIIAEQGPFSKGKNTEHIKKANADYLVTKDSGEVGGFYEKISAAEKCGAEILIIKRPVENGIELREAEKIIASEKSYE